MPRIEPPTEADLRALLGGALPAWQAMNARIEALYETEVLWSTGGKAAPYEKKYRRGGKTLCAPYPRQDEFGLLVVLGRAEQEKFENAAGEFSAGVRQSYEETKVYHDGRWLMLWLRDDPQLPDVEKLLAIKRRPNRKQTDK